MLLPGSEQSRVTSMSPTILSPASLSSITLSPGLLAELQLWIARHFGLNFPPERWTDFQRHLQLVARELGYADVVACAADILKETPDKRLIIALIRALTVGETYFLRDAAFFARLKSDVLVPLIARRRSEGILQLRLWSAGCCTGEEAYTLAILLEEELPDIGHWTIDVIGTDLNPEFLRKARSGLYGNWSFRQVPVEWRERHFQQQPDGHWLVAEHLRQRVSFQELNLVEANYPDAARGLAQCDVILCRNVLMYFAPLQAFSTLQRLSASLNKRGTLFLAAVENLFGCWAGLDIETWPSAVCIRNETEASSHLESKTPNLPGNKLPGKTLQTRPGHAIAANSASANSITANSITAKPLAETPPQTSAVPVSLYQPVEREVPSPFLLDYAKKACLSGHYERALHLLDKYLKHGVVSLKHQAEAAALCARVHANTGRLAEAVDWAEESIQMDRLNPLHYWVLASVLDEQGRVSAAYATLTKALYLAPEFLLAQYLSGLLSIKLRRYPQAIRHLKNCLAGLHVLPCDSLVPEGEGLSAAELTDMAQAALHKAMASAS